MPTKHCRYAAWLFNEWHRLPILLCGGGGSLDVQPYSATMRDLVQEEAVLPEMGRKSPKTPSLEPRFFLAGISDDSPYSGSTVLCPLRKHASVGRAYRVLPIA
jgi:hypothetical protein